MLAALLLHRLQNKLNWSSSRGLAYAGMALGHFTAKHSIAFRFRLGQESPKSARKQLTSVVEMRKYNVNTLHAHAIYN